MVITALSIMLASSSFFVDGETEAQRLKKIAPYFSPAIGQKVSIIESPDLRKYLNESPDKMRGYIEVSPPKGHCFTINRGMSVEDAYVCKKTNVRFSLNEATREGNLQWIVNVDDSMDQTILNWHVPYRIAYVTPIGKPLDSTPEYRYLKGCDAKIDSTGTRIIKLALLNGPVWSIRFPDKDTLLPQPLKRRNLSVNGSGKRSVADAAEDAAQLEQQMEERAKNNPNAQKKTAENSSTESKAIDFAADRKIWHIPMKDGYVMSSDSFMPNGDVTPGMKGFCRYRFSGTQDDLEVGRIECKDADLYQFMYAPLTCLKDLGGPRT